MNDYNQPMTFLCTLFGIWCASAVPEASPKYDTTIVVTCAADKRTDDLPVIEAGIQEQQQLYRAKGGRIALAVSGTCYLSRAIDIGPEINHLNFLRRGETYSMSGEPLKGVGYPK